MRRAPRGSRRGFSHVSTTLEAAAIMGWFAIAVVSEKKLDEAVTNRRAVESSAQDSAHASGASCSSQSNDRAVGDATPKSTVSIGPSTNLGLDPSKMPSVGALGLSHSDAFPSESAPIKVASVTSRSTASASDERGGEESAGSYRAERKVACQEPPPLKKSALDAAGPLRESLWEKNLRGYR